RQDGRKQNEGTHKSIEAVVARLEKQNGMSLSSNSSPEATFMETSERMNNMDDAVVPRVLYEELLRSYQQQQEEMRHIQQELERTRRQLVQQAKKLKEYGTLVSEMKELRDLNRRLQDVLLLRLGSGKYLDIQPKTLLPHLDNQSPDRGTVIPCFSNSEAASDVRLFANWNTHFRVCSQNGRVPRCLRTKVRLYKERCSFSKMAAILLWHYALATAARMVISVAAAKLAEGLGSAPKQNLNPNQNSRKYIIKAKQANNTPHHILKGHQMSWLKGNVFIWPAMEVTQRRASEDDLRVW
ncbi:Hypothetical predicted protein, partial [Podarcis lilfordi]